MPAKSWNYVFMDSRIMLAKSSYYALARGDTYSFCCAYGASNFGNCAFFVLASGHEYNKYMSIPLPRCPCMLEINMEKRKHYFFYSLVDFFCCERFSLPLKTVMFSCLCNRHTRPTDVTLTLRILIISSSLP